MSKTISESKRKKMQRKKLEKVIAGFTVCAFRLGFILLAFYYLFRLELSEDAVKFGLCVITGTLFCAYPLKDLVNGVRG